MGGFLITGASGYLGARIGQDLIRLGHKVVGLGRRKDPGPLSFEYRSVDLGNEEQIQEISSLVAEFGVDTVIHLASLDQKSSSSLVDEVFRVNVLGTQHLLHALGESPEVDLFFFSTIHSYGPVLGKITEESPTKPIKEYGLTHLMSETLLNFDRSKVTGRRVNLRLSNGYGWSPVMNDQAKRLVVNDLCRQAIEEGRLDLLSDGSPVLDFIYVGDLAPLLLKLKKGNREVNTALVTSGVGVSLYELAITIADEAGQLLGKTLRVQRGGVDLAEPIAAKVGVFHSCLGEGLHRPLREGIRATLEDFR